MSKRGTANSGTRTAIVEAATALLIESGYASVTSRNIGVKAGLKSNLVHYYFKTMDEVFIAVYNQFAEQFVAKREAARAADRPLRRLWELSTNQDDLTIIYEFVALGNHRKELRAEIARSGRAMQDINLEVIRAAIARKGLGWVPDLPHLFSTIFESTARTATLHGLLGLGAIHGPTVRLISRVIDFLDD